MDKQTSEQQKPAPIDHCEGCGFCCESFMLEDPQQWRADYVDDDRVQRWLDEDIIALDAEEVIALGYIAEDKVYETVETPGMWYYSCRLFNKETQRCTSHKDRPFICKDFPAELEDADAFIKPCNMAIQLYSKNGDKNG